MGGQWNALETACTGLGRLGGYGGGGGRLGRAISDVKGGLTVFPRAM